MVTAARARGGVGKPGDLEGGRGGDEGGGKGRSRNRGVSPMLVAILGFGVAACFVAVIGSIGYHPAVGERPGRGGNQQKVKASVDNPPPPATAAPLTAQAPHSGSKTPAASAPSTAQGPHSDSKNEFVLAVDHTKDPKDPYPFYKVSLDPGGARRLWPGVGWQSAIGKDDERFRNDFKFYMLEEGAFDMSKAERCFRENMKIFDANDPARPHLLDENLRLNQRQYLVELYYWPALREHKMRTMNPEEADMFFIGYSPYLNHQSYPCPGLPTTKEWEIQVATELKQSKWWKRRGGQDHFMFYMKYNILLPKELHDVLDVGVNVITTDRHYWSISHNLKQTFEDGRVLVVPYVMSTFMDSQFFDYHTEHVKNPQSHYMFFGNLRRRFGGRSYVIDLADMLQGANFKGTELHREPIPDVLNQTAAVMRESTICLCPSGDAPTSVRVFEAMASGCIPLILGYKDKMHTDMPFPSLVDWDSVAFFADSLESITKRKDGLAEFAKTLEATLGAGNINNIQDRIDKMRREGNKVFNEHLAFRRNPVGATESMLFEAWVLLQKRGLKQGPFYRSVGA